MTNVHELIRALGDPRAGVRDLAVKRFAMMGERAVPILISLLTDPDLDIAENAVRALKAIGKASVLSLHQAMKSPNRKIQWAAAWALSCMHEEDVRAAHVNSGRSARLRKAFHEWVLQPEEVDAEPAYH